DFCKLTAQGNYGEAGLTAKVTVSFGSVAYFQKAHEQGTEDWSAEGDPFVQCARLEQAVESKQRVYLLDPLYKALFQPSENYAAAGERYYWTTTTVNVQVEGLGLSGGWAQVSQHEYIPGGRT